MRAVNPSHVDRAFLAKLLAKLGQDWLQALAPDAPRRVEVDKHKFVWLVQRKVDDAHKAKKVSNTVKHEGRGGESNSARCLPAYEHDKLLHVKCNILRASPAAQPAPLNAPTHPGPPL